MQQLQRSFEDLGTPLFETTFAVVDLETTGGSPEDDAITEIAALKSRCGQLMATFHTLVRPGRAIPASIKLLTGIDDALVAGAPEIETVLPSLWEFLSGTVLVAHNARFDASFLAAAFGRHGYETPFRKCVCTLRLARRLLQGETRDLRLQTLAASLGLGALPCHRALPDARAAFDVFHHLLELAGPLGVLTLEDLVAFTRVGRRPDLSKLALTARLPRLPGVYRFLDPAGRVLYVGKAKNLRSRVRSYFFGDERPHIAGLVAQTARVEAEPLPAELAAEIRELQLIRLHQPRYNRRGRRRASPAWIRVTSGEIPRVILARAASQSTASLLGPFASRAAAGPVLEALQAALPIPRCTDPRRYPAGCAFGEMGHCLAPCLPEGRPAHAALVGRLRQQISDGGGVVFGRLEARMHDLADRERYEEAAGIREGIRALAAAIERRRMLRTLRAAADLVVCLPLREGLVEVAAIRRGRLRRCWRSLGPPAFDPADLFPPEPPQEAREPSPASVDELAAVWRFLTRAARGGWVAWCSGSLVCRLPDAPAARWAAWGRNPRQA